MNMVEDKKIRKGDTIEVWRLVSVERREDIERELSIIDEDAAAEGAREAAKQRKAYLLKKLEDY